MAGYLDGTFGRGGHARGVLDGPGPGGPVAADRQGSRCDRHRRGAFRRRSARADLPRLVRRPARLGRRPRRASTACCSIWACRRRSWMWPSAASASARTVRWTCAWIRTGRERGAVVGHAPPTPRSPTCCGHYGEEKLSRKIARAIVASAARGAVHAHRRAGRLIAVVVGRGDSKIHPATRSFQAIRIFINRELDDLERGLDAAVARAQAGRPPGGDQLPFAGRPHRQALHRRARQGAAGQPPPALESRTFTADLRDVSGALQRRRRRDCGDNPRARSAVLRVAEKLRGGGA